MTLAGCANNGGNEPWRGKKRRDRESEGYQAAGAHHTPDGCSVKVEPGKVFGAIRCRRSTLRRRHGPHRVGQGHDERDAGDGEGRGLSGAKTRQGAVHGSYGRFGHLHAGWQESGIAPRTQSFV